MCEKNVLHTSFNLLLNNLSENKDSFTWLKLLPKKATEVGKTRQLGHIEELIQIVK